MLKKVRRGNQKRETSSRKIKRGWRGWRKSKIRIRKTNSKK
ncbi:hypothetical protein [Mycoplasma phocimorsus]|nr:hypothetical protein [Mycoplasma phocimorsus]MDJ1646463.1 hypothetical protein [Mycoplasma phocimorsus]MDJ1648873.1 hypothetical protein [Mycoplasma phocimorsus]